MAVIPARAIILMRATLELGVVNFWPNRLIGDAALPPEKCRTATNITKFTADSPLLEARLLGR
jgi:hypothetical protein